MSEVPFLEFFITKSSLLYLVQTLPSFSKITPLNGKVLKWYIDNFKYELKSQDKHESLFGQVMLCYVNLFKVRNKLHSQ